MAADLPFQQQASTSGSDAQQASMIYKRGNGHTISAWFCARKQMVLRPKFA
jgi:hypothetical protein